MAREITMPKLAMTQETGIIIQWYKSEGDFVEVGEPLFEAMTNKVNIDVESYDQGVLLKQLYQAGAEVVVLEVIGYIGQPGEQIPDALHQGQSQNAHPAEATENPVTGPHPLPNYAVDNGPVRATPSARALARTYGANLTLISGSGKNGRIHREDVTAFVEGHKAELPDSQREIEMGKPLEPSVESHDVTSEQKTSVRRYEQVVPLSGIRKVIGQRMSQSAFNAPHVTLTMEVDMFAATELRKQMMPIVEKQTAVRLSMNTIILKCAASVLRKYPNVNSTWHGNDELVLHQAVHLGMAVATPNGLFVPVIYDADQLGLSELTIATTQLAERARTNTLAPDTLQGGTFTVSNLGMYGIEGFTPIINTPQVAILGVGCIIEKPVAIQGNVQIRPQMTLSLSFDHRALDGSDAAQFLRDIKNTLEQPMMLLA